MKNKTVKVNDDRKISPCIGQRDRAVYYAYADLHREIIVLDILVSDKNYR
jgi:hypothetical protein